MKGRAKLLLLLLAVVVSGASLAVVPASAITDGQPDGNGHPNVGLMVVQFGTADPQRLCSGELIAPTFLINNTSVHLVGVTFDPTFDPNTSSTIIPAASVTVTRCSERISVTCMTLE